MLSAALNNRVSVLRDAAHSMLSAVAWLLDVSKLRSGAPFLHKASVVRTLFTASVQAFYQTGWLLAVATKHAISIGRM